MEKMKRYMKLLSMIALGLSIGSCVDDAVLPYEVQKPESIAQYEYLNAYDVLKSYIDRSKYPNFKLGTGITASDFNKKGIAYELVTTNFDEMTAGNAMKYASCVSDEGTMNFNTVSDFVQTAKEAGITIYGHTLAWHAQQNNKFLNNLIKDKEIEVDPGEEEVIEDAFVDYADYDKFPFYVMGYEPQMIDGQLVSSNPEGEWIQYFVADNVPTIKGRNYKVTALIQGSASGALDVQMGDWGGNIKTSMGFSTEWKEVTVELVGVPAEKSFVIFQPGTFTGDIRIKWLKVTHSEAPSVTIPMPVIEKDFSDGTPIDGWDNGNTGMTRIVEDGVCIVDNPKAAPNSWDNQLCEEVTTPFEMGTTYFLKMKVKGTNQGNIVASLQNPDGYKGCGDFPAFKVTTDWQEVTVRTTCTGENATRLLFTVGNYVGTLYMDDICLYWEKSANTIPLTPEEKKETLTLAMENWIRGMMEACDGYVTAWDAVNEALSGGDKDGDGVYDLQSATRGTVSAEDAINNFYWQDYLGDLDYVRTVVRFARKYFEETGGNPSDLKLFINDYNLESDWDDNGKMKSMLKWIGRWEEDGITKIDGIGTQMHVSCYMDPLVQKGKEEYVVKMFELMASSGKLIKISELDMGVVGTDGIDVKTEDITFEQEQAMAKYYNFIVRKYFEIIPVAQQYGITHWSPTDSPANSGWRANSPIGLWNLEYTRKPAYAGFADGLAGKKSDVTEEE